MVTSFAMALNIPVVELMQKIGHTGSATVFAGLPEPMCRRGFHVQECIVAAVDLGFAVTPIELFPVSSSYGHNFTVLHGPEDRGSERGNWNQFTHSIRTSRGVITGNGKACGHAVAYDHGRIFDPDGDEFDYSPEACLARGFITLCLWRVDRFDNGASVDVS